MLLFANGTHSLLDFSPYTTIFHQTKMTPEKAGKGRVSSYNKNISP